MAKFIKKIKYWTKTANCIVFRRSKLLLYVQSLNFKVPDVRGLKFCFKIEMKLYFWKLYTTAKSQRIHEQNKNTHLQRNFFKQSEYRLFDWDLQSELSMENDDSITLKWICLYKSCNIGVNRLFINNTVPLNQTTTEIRGNWRLKSLIQLETSTCYITQFYHQLPRKPMIIQQWNLIFIKTRAFKSSPSFIIKAPIEFIESIM